MGTCTSFTSHRTSYVRPDPSKTETTVLDHADEPPSRMFEVCIDVYEFLDKAHNSIPENATVVHSIPRQPFRLLMLGK